MRNLIYIFNKKCLSSKCIRIISDCPFIEIKYHIFAHIKCGNIIQQANTSKRKCNQQHVTIIVPIIKLKRPCVRITPTNLMEHILAYNM